MAQQAPCCVWDFTVGAEFTSQEALRALLKNHGKKWAFQLEEGSNSGYKHYQGRVSLQTKMRLKQVKVVFGINEIHWSVTSNANRDNLFYVTKENTRIEGPWKDTDVVEYIPRQIRGITLKPWQQAIVESAKEWDTRHINIIHDTQGNIGKTTIKTYVRAHGIGRFIPFVNDYKDMMRIIMDCPKMPLYIIDIPRAIQKDRLFQFYAGIETLKDGYAYDDRYHFKDELFDCPVIWVFTNVRPEQSMLSADRWRFWGVRDDALEALPSACGL
jgi:Putative viral replication protein